MGARLILPEWCGKLDDPRLTIHYQDAGEFLPGNNNKYDLIVWDLVDPHRWDNSGLTAASNLYKPDFFDSMKEHLAENGLLSVGYAYRNRQLMASLLKDWRKVSRKRIYIPSFEESWEFVLMDKNYGMN